MIMEDNSCGIENAEPQASSAPEPRKVSLEDRQSIEVIYLKIENIKLQERVLQADLVRAGQMKVELQKEMLAKSDEFRVKYGMELGRDQVLPDGTITQVVNGAPSAKG